MASWFSWQWLVASIIGFGILVALYYYGTKNAMRIAFWMIIKVQECKKHGEKIGIKVREMWVPKSQKEKSERN